MRKSIESTKNLSQILFLDIETCAEHPTYDDLSAEEQRFWDKKCQHIKRPSDHDFGTSESFFYKRRAGIYAEYAKVVCISIGYVDVISQYRSTIFTKTFFNEDENALLIEFSRFISSNMAADAFVYLCGHNIKEFDIPFLCRRMVLNNIKLPQEMNVSGLKPWQTPQFIDTLELWKFGDYKNYISLDLMCSLFKVPSPKGDVGGDNIHELYWHAKNYKSIIQYCEGDVYAVAQVFIKLKQIYPKMVFSHMSKTDLNRL